jgi:hypothetical protein
MPDTPLGSVSCQNRHMIFHRSADNFPGITVAISGYPPRPGTFSQRRDVAPAASILSGLCSTVCFAYKHVTAPEIAGRWGTVHRLGTALFDKYVNENHTQLKWKWFIVFVANFCNSRDSGYLIFKYNTLMNFGYSRKLHCCYIVCSN